MQNEDTKEPEKNQIDELIATLHVTLPEGKLTLTTKVIAFLTSAGGLSILAGILADVVRPGGISLGHYILRIIIGIIMTAVGYGIIKQKGWVVWLYGSISIISLMINPIVSVIPLLITIYLYRQKIYFDKHAPAKAYSDIKNYINTH